MEDFPTPPSQSFALATLDREIERVKAAVATGDVVGNATVTNLMFSRDIAHGIYAVREQLAELAGVASKLDDLLTVADATREQAARTNGAVARLQAQSKDSDLALERIRERNNQIERDIIALKELSATAATTAKTLADLKLKLETDALVADTRKKTIVDMLKANWQILTVVGAVLGGILSGGYVKISFTGDPAKPAATQGTK